MSARADLKCSFGFPLRSCIGTSVSSCDSCDRKALRRSDIKSWQKMLSMATPGTEAERRAVKHLSALIFGGDA